MRCAIGELPPQIFCNPGRNLSPILPLTFFYQVMGAFPESGLVARETRDAPQTPPDLPRFEAFSGRTLPSCSNSTRDRGDSRSLTHGDGVTRNGHRSPDAARVELRHADRHSGRKRIGIPPCPVRSLHRGPPPLSRDGSPGGRGTGHTSLFSFTSRRRGPVRPGGSTRIHGRTRDTLAGLTDGRVRRPRAPTSGETAGRVEHPKTEPPGGGAGTREDSLLARSDRGMPR